MADLLWFLAAVAVGWILRSATDKKRKTNTETTKRSIGLPRHCRLVVSGAEQEHFALCTMEDMQPVLLNAMRAADTGLDVLIEFRDATHDPWTERHPWSKTDYLRDRTRIARVPLPSLYAQYVAAHPEMDLPPPVPVYATSTSYPPTSRQEAHRR